MTHLILITIIIAAAFALHEARLIAKRIKGRKRMHSRKSHEAHRGHFIPIP